MSYTFDDVFTDSILPKLIKLVEDKDKISEISDTDSLSDRFISILTTACQSGNTDLERKLLQAAVNPTYEEVPIESFMRLCFNIQCPDSELLELKYLTPDNITVNADYRGELDADNN